MGTLTTGNIKAGALESSDSPAVNTYVSFANSTVSYDSTTAYTAGGQEIETFDFTENGLSTGSAFVYEKSGAGKLQGYPGFCIVSDQVDGSQIFVDRGPSKHQISVTGDTHHDSGGSKYLHNPTSIYFDGTGDYLIIPLGAELMPGLNDFTFEFWGLGTGTSSTRGWFTFYQSSTNKFHFTNYANLEFYSVIGGVNDNVTLAHSQDTNWHHYAVVRNGTELTMYVDGKIIAKNGNYTLDLTITSGPGTIYIGVRTDNGSDFTTYSDPVYIDDFRYINGKALYTTNNFSPPARSPQGTEAYGDVADYTKITMMGYRSDSSSYFTAINYVAGNEVVARDYMGIGYDDLQSVAYSGSTQKIMVYNNTTNTVKFTAYVEATT